MLDALGWGAVAFALSAAACGALLAYQRYQTRQMLRGSVRLHDEDDGPPFAELSAPPNFTPRLLVLGPAASGKSTILRHAVSAGSPSGVETDWAEQCSYQPTLGLVRQLLLLPSSKHGGVNAIVCDAGGGAQQRRQWVELVRGVEVHSIIFVVDAADCTSETLFLFRQLVNAPWAKRCVATVAFTKIDLLSWRQGARAGSPSWRTEREEEFRLVCPLPLTCHWLCARRAESVTSLFIEVVDTVISMSSDIEKPPTSTRS
ncbi:hypothetical protein AB1Y20_008608 [Prymnesium parvum]|uniref:Signal recognition particle receptor subunit beta n=1 Tax=Prymnesium parvum TaxID=97485 RepID=A0AB34IRL9_PRYPA